MTDTDKDLLERAARAAGIEIEWRCWPMSAPESAFFKNGLASELHGECYSAWSPLTDDGDAFRLESGLRLDVKWGNGSVTVGGATERYSHGDDPSAIKRRAIVRAAAALGDAK